MSGSHEGTKPRRVKEENSAIALGKKQGSVRLIAGGDSSLSFPYSFVTSCLRVRNNSGHKRV